MQVVVLVALMFLSVLLPTSGFSIAFLRPWERLAASDTTSDGFHWQSQWLRFMQSQLPADTQQPAANAGMATPSWQQPAPKLEVSASLPPLEQATKEDAVSTTNDAPLLPSLLWPTTGIKMDEAVRSALGMHRAAPAVATPPQDDNFTIHDHSLVAQKSVAESSHHLQNATAAFNVTQTNVTEILKSGRETENVASDIKTFSKPQPGKEHPHRSTSGFLVPSTLALLSAVLVSGHSIWPN